MRKRHSEFTSAHRSRFIDRTNHFRGIASSKPGLSFIAPWEASSGSEKKNIEDFSRPLSKLPARGPTGNG